MQDCQPHPNSTWAEAYEAGHRSHSDMNHMLQERSLIFSKIKNKTFFRILNNWERHKPSREEGVKTPLLIYLSTDAIAVCSTLRRYVYTAPKTLGGVEHQRVDFARRRYQVGMEGRSLGMMGTLAGLAYPAPGHGGPRLRPGDAETELRILTNAPAYHERTSDHRAGQPTVLVPRTAWYGE